MSNNVTDILRGVVSELREISRSETIVGEPVQAGSRTVIPIVKISVGFGVGGGEGTKPDAKAGFGGGGGGGAKIEPAAFLIIDKDDVKLVTATKGKWEQIFEAVPGFAKKIGNVLDKLGGDKEDKKDGKGKGEGKGEGKQHRGGEHDEPSEKDKHDS
jgi:uncharacterized spore protein YtfJ